MAGYNIVVANEFKYLVSLIIRLLAIKNVYVADTQYNIQISSDMQGYIEKSRLQILNTLNIDILKNGLHAFLFKHCFFHKPLENFQTRTCYPSSVEEALKLVANIFEQNTNIPLSVGNPSFIKWCIKHFYNRNASDSEIDIHVTYNSTNNITLLTWLFTMYLCEEGKQYGVNKSLELLHYNDTKIALLFCGHIRDLQAVVHTHTQLVYHPNYDIFIHTWNDTGIKSRDLWYKHWMLPNQISVEKTYVNDFYHSIDMLVEDNKTMLPKLSLVGKINPIFLFESQARDDASKYINSQLYSIYKAYTLVKNYEKNSGIQYHGVLKLRFDMDISHLSQKNILNDMKHTCVYFPHGHCNNHRHFGGGGGCLTCDSETDTKLHTKHTNDICDIWFYTNRRLMEYTCSMYNYVLDILKKNHQNNLNLLATLGHDRIDPFVYIRGSAIEGDVVCFYPERMLREHLAQYHCKSSMHIQGKIFDSSK
jgi:hypothetical protein